jgi:UDP-GlcNAc:undecaprenyl-phosphate/decaprenyl-phosphate GlcNAc-1-phosphate transferase
MTPLISSLLAAAVAAAVSFSVAGLVRRAVLARGILVAPRPDRWHQVPTPTYGGLGVFIGVVAGAALSGGLAAPVWPILLAGLALFVVGLFDDVVSLSALAKMVSSLAVAAFFVLSIVTVPAATPMHAALTVLAILCFGGLDNAVNLLDNMDGLAAGVTAMAAAGLALTFGAELGPAIVAVLAALSGALVGFLGWNRYPARMFMGNCGSLAIGGVLAASATLAVVRSGTLQDAAAALLILVVPVFDSSFVLLLRRLAGRSTTRGNVDHTSHRLVSAGFNDRTAVWLLYALGLVGAAAGFWLRMNPGTAGPVAAAVGVGTLMVAVWLARVPAYAGQDFRAFQNAPFAPLISDLTFRWHAGEVLLDIVLISSCYYAAYRIRFEGDADLPVFLTTFAKSLPAILGTQLAALYASGLYQRLWRTFGLHDLSTVIRAVASGVILSLGVVVYLYKFEAFSRSVFIIYAGLLTVAIVATRSSFRVFGRMAAHTGARRVAIYGAGARGQLLARELQANDDGVRTPVAFVDDDEGKQSRRVVGVAVRGTARDLGALIARYRIDEVLISSPAIGTDAEARVREICAAKGVAVARLFYEIR